MPIKIHDLELTEGIRPICGLERYGEVRLLVRYHRRPIGWATIGNKKLAPAVSTETIVESVQQQLGRHIMQVVVRDSLCPLSTDPKPLAPVSVVVCTRDRTEQLKDCLASLLEIDYPTFEIIVVDNAPKDDSTARLAAGLPVRYVRENRPGLDWARNCGIARARFDIVAFTDDDARPDRYWLHALNAAFSEQDVMAVTGMAAPAELETPAQILFEFGYGGMSKGTLRRVMKRASLTDRDLLWACSFGLGANMAFRRSVFSATGLFDVSLDVGTPTRGGGDIEMFHRIVASGYTLVYEPAALVWHVHRPSYTALSRQLQSNGYGFGAYLLTCLRNRSVQPGPLACFALKEWLYGRLVRRLIRSSRFPRRLVLSELSGALLSPLAYRSALKNTRRITALASEYPIAPEPRIK